MATLDQPRERLPYDFDELADFVFDDLNEDGRFPRLQEVGLTVPISRVPTASGDVKVRVKRPSGSTATATDALFLRPILDRTLYPGKTQVKAKLAQFGFITDASLTEALRALQLNEGTEHLFRRSIDPAEARRPRQNHLMEYDNLLVLFEYSHYLDSATAVDWGDFGHFHAAAASFHTLVETDTKSAAPADLDNSVMDEAVNSMVAGNFDIEVDSDDESGASMQLCYPVPNRTPYEERVTTFTIDFISALGSCHESTRRLDCAMKPDRISFRFARKTGSVGCAVDATLQRLKTDTIQSNVPPDAKDVTKLAWSMLLTAEFKSNSVQQKSKDSVQKVMVQVVFEMAARLYDMYVSSDKVSVDLPGERALLGLVVIGSEFIPVLTIYTSQWLRYIADSRSRVWQAGLAPRDCLQVVRLGSYKIHGTDHKRHTHMLSAILLAILIHSRSAERQNPPNWRTGISSALRRQQEMKEKMARQTTSKIPTPARPSASTGAAGSSTHAGASRSIQNLERSRDQVSPLSKDYSHKKDGSRKRDSDKKEDTRQRHSRREEEKRRLEEERRLADLAFRQKQHRGRVG